MRIPRPWIPIISGRIVETLFNEELIVPDVDRGELAAEIEALMTGELEIEDRLNDEVREILKKFEFDIERGRLDYRRLFDMTKQKLIRERNLVI
jgi:hypothetical protein